jgi:hypothetical protein
VDRPLGAGRAAGRRCAGVAGLTSGLAVFPPSFSEADPLLGYHVVSARITTESEDVRMNFSP